MSETARAAHGARRGRREITAIPCAPGYLNIGADYSG
jgi:hypothetical protein